MSRKGLEPQAPRSKVRKWAVPSMLASWQPIIIGYDSAKAWRRLISDVRTLLPVIFIAETN